jgi:hypothetical protein
MSGPLRIEAVVGDGEHLALSGAIEELRHCFAAASGGAFPIELRIHSALSAIKVVSRPTLIVTSLLLELTEPEKPLAAIEARLRSAISALIRDGVSAIFLCTVFRRIEPATKAIDPGAAAACMERIRRLNFLAAELSHDFDIYVIDFDRSFAHIGGRSLGTDFNLNGSAAVQAAKHVIASTLFAAGLDDFYPSELWDEVTAIYDQRCTDLALPKLAVSASTLGFVQEHKGGRLQTFAMDATPRRLRYLLRSLMEGRMTAAETVLIVLRAAQRRVQRLWREKTV